VTPPPAPVATVTTSSPEETEAFGRRLGAHLRAGDVVALVGPMGAGKTVLARGLALGAGATGYIASPSFVVIREYAGPLHVYHIDLYRLEEAHDIAYLGLDDLIGGEGIAIVEWADRAPWLLPPEHLHIVCTPGPQSASQPHMRAFTLTIPASMRDRLAAVFSA